MKDANDIKTQDMFPEAQKRRRGRPSTGQAKTAAQRMAEYRERRKHGETGDKGQGGERVLNTAMSTAAFLALEEQAKCNGVTKKECLELLLLSASEPQAASSAQLGQVDQAAQQEIAELRARLTTLQAQLDEAKEEARTLNARASAQSKQLKDQRALNSNLKGRATKLRNQLTQHANLLRTLVIWYTRAEPDTGFKLLAAPDLVPQDRAYLESHWLNAFELVNGPLSEYPGDDAVAEQERAAAKRVIERYQKEQGTP